MKKLSIPGLARTAFTVLACLLFLPWQAPASPLVMGLASTDSRESLLKDWQPILDDLSTALNRQVEAMILDDYAGVIWYMATGRAQIAWLGNKAAIEAVDRAGAEVLVQTRNKYGAGYRAHLITRREAPWTCEEDVLAHSAEIEFGIGDPNSTSGYTVPSYYLFAAEGIDPNKAFKRLVHHNHEENFLAVASGELDVATSNSQALSRFKTRFPARYQRIKIIWTSPLIPSDPILVRSDLDPALKADIRAFFLGYAKPGPGKSEADVRRETANLAARSWTGFQGSDNSQLEPVRKLEFYKRRLQLERDESLSETEKLDRLQKINAAIKGLDEE